MPRTPAKSKVAPTPPISVQDRSTRNLGVMLDTYLQGDPASGRMPMTPKSSYPELNSDGYYSSQASNLHSLYEEMLIKDGNIYGILEQRRSAVLARPRQIIPHSTNDDDIQIARFVEKSLQLIAGDDGGFDSDIDHLLHSAWTGLAIMEIDWMKTREIEAGTENGITFQGGPWIIPRQLLHRYPGNFVFDKAGRMYYNKGIGSRNNMEEVPLRKYLVQRFGSNYENPYGAGLLQHVWWYYRFKIECTRNWLIATAKFGSPTAVASVPDGATPELCEQVDAILERIANDTGVRKPESITLELLSAAGGANGSSSPFRELMEYCDDGIARAVVGSTLTSGEGRRSGSLALGQVHFEVAQDKIEQDSRALMWVINNQLIRWIVDLNFGMDKPCPRWEIDTSSEDQAVRDLEIDEKLVKLGVALPVKYFYERFKRSMPAEDEPVIRYDDRNLLQYHMQYSVLTINEVRARLGLEPIQWGNLPTNMQAAIQATLPGQEAPKPAAPPQEPEAPGNDNPTPETEYDEKRPSEMADRTLVQRFADAIRSVLPGKKKALYEDPWS